MVFMLGNFVVVMAHRHVCQDRFLIAREQCDIRRSLFIGFSCDYARAAVAMRGTS